MTQPSVPATPRTAFGKGPNRRLRASGKIPAVVYGGSKGPVALSLAPRHIVEIVRSARGVNTIFALQVAGEASEQVMIHDYQLHPLDHAVLHADLMRVDPDREAEWHVPVKLVGSARGVRRGGHLDFITRSLTVICLPHDIPENLPLEITALDYGDTVRASAVELPSRLTLASDPDVVVAHVAAPKVKADEEEEGAEELEGDIAD